MAVVDAYPASLSARQADLLRQSVDALGEILADLVHSHHLSAQSLQEVRHVRDETQHVVHCHTQC